MRFTAELGAGQPVPTMRAVAQINQFRASASGQAGDQVATHIGGSRASGPAVWGLGSFAGDLWVGMARRLGQESEVSTTGAMLG